MLGFTVLMSLSTDITNPGAVIVNLEADVSPALSFQLYSAEYVQWSVRRDTPWMMYGPLPEKSEAPIGSLMKLSPAPSALSLASNMRYRRSQ